jgi:hypothetical protein
MLQLFEVVFVDVWTLEVRMAALTQVMRVNLSVNH